MTPLLQSISACRDQLVREEATQERSRDVNGPTSFSNAALARICSLHWDVSDAAAHLLSQSQCFKEAIHLVEDNLHVLLTSGTYSMDDVLIAREYVKLMQLCFANGDLAACRRNLETAMRSLRPYVSDDDPDWILCLEIATTINY